MVLSTEFLEHTFTIDTETALEKMPGTCSFLLFGGAFLPLLPPPCSPQAAAKMEALAKMVCPCHITRVSFLRGSSLLQRQTVWPMVVLTRVQNHFPSTQAAVPWLVLS